MEYLFGLLIIVLTVAGQLFLKLGADKAKMSHIYNGYVLTGYLLFFLTILCSYHFMKLVPMKYITVIMSMCYVSVMIAAKYFLREEVKREKFIGTMMVAFGVFVFML